MQLYRIPALYCPFTPTIHPLHHEIEEHTNQWILDFQLIDTYETFIKYKKSRFPAFIARSFPNADYIAICAWSDLNALLFIVDDQIDAQDILTDKESFLQVERNFLEILEYNKRCSIGADGPVLTALSDFWNRMLLYSSTAWQHKFIQGIKDMFAGGMWQFEHVMKGRRPDFDEYMQVRQYFGAAHLSTDVLEVTGKILLEEAVYADPAVHKLTEICRNTICFSNDLFSLGKELEESQNGGEFNLVTILKHKHNLTMEDAIKATAAFHDSLVKDFVELSKNIYIFDNSTNEMLHKYIQALGCLMAANIEWSTKETNRYPHIYGGLAGNPASDN